MTERSFDDILNGEETAVEPEATEAPAETVETPEPVAEEQPVEQAGQPRGPDGKFLPKGDKEPEAPAASATPAPQEEAGHIPIAALKDERSKRQTLENEIAQLREQMQRMQQPQPEAQVEEQGPPDRWDDPEGYDRWLVNQAATAARAEALQAYQTERIKADVAQFSAGKPDYAQTIQTFQQMASTNPALYEQMLQQPSPAKFAYETAKTHLEIQQYGSLEALVAAKVEAAQKEALAAVQSQLPASVPPSISSDRSVGSRSGPAWSGPASIDDLLR